MADIVQFRLERMVPELEDLESRSLFTRSELFEIVKRRRKFEYRLRRPSPLKSDFLDYIEYEKQLDRLRILRKKMMNSHNDDDGIEGKGKRKKKGKRRVGDYGGVRRIIEVYGMATTRFKGDLGLWMEFLEFCRERKHGRLNKVLAQAIRFHPKVPALWIYAAAWEFDHNLNAAAARVMMQSGLRACPNSEDLWVEYLRMELTYLNKLKTRKVILGEDVGTLIRDDKDAVEKQWRDENKELFMSLEGSGKAENGLDEENGESLEKVDVFREQGFSILRTIYKGGIEAIPASFPLRRRFFEILEATNLANSELRDEILTDMKRDFSKDPEYWSWLARREISDPGTVLDISSESVRCQVDKALQVYEGAFEALPTAAMIGQYIGFLMHLLVNEGDSATLNTSDHGLKYISHLMSVFERAKTMGCLTLDLALQQISLYLQLGRFDEAKKFAGNYSAGEFSNAAQIWDLRVSLKMNSITRKPPTNAHYWSVFKLFRTAVTKAAVSNAQNLWLTALEFFAHEKRFVEKLVELSMVSLMRDGGSEDGFSLSWVIVESVLQKDGIQKARELYKRYISLPRPGLALYRHCIGLEKNLASSGDKEGLVNARKLFEAALSTYKDDTSLWKDYFTMEMEMGNSETANGVYWRAKKILKEEAVVLIYSRTQHDGALQAEDQF